LHWRGRCGLAAWRILTGPALSLAAARRTDGRQEDGGFNFLTQTGYIVAECSSEVRVSSIPASAAPADIVGYSIVLVGQFDPGQAQPSLLAKAGLLDEGDLSDLTYDMLVKDLVIAKLPWIVFTIERTKLTALTTLQFPVAEPVRDFVLDLIELMPSKRYTALGINRDTHMPLQSRELYQALLDKLAGSPERDSLADDVYEGALLRPVPLTLSIQGRRDDGARGTVTVRLEPSLQISPGSRSRFLWPSELGAPQEYYPVVRPRVP
jgi:hypothetical protein